MDYLILHRLARLPHCTPNWGDWTRLADIADELNQTKGPRVEIAIVGKYTGLQDSYLSLIKALEHASFYEKAPIHINWIESTDLERPSDAPSNSNSHPHDTEQSERYARAMKTINPAHGILVPGGFGDRGVEGKISAIQYARTRQVPFFGICLGMQEAVVEFTRNVLDVASANSEEFDQDCKHKAVVFMPEISKTHMGGTMRLGRRTTYFVERHRGTSRVRKLYQETAHLCAQFGIRLTLDEDGEVVSVDERHRHRYEVNPEYVGRLEEAGMSFVGMDETQQRMEIVELPDHPYFVGVQYHPEFQSRPQWPSPPFVGFVRAAAAYLKRKHTPQMDGVDGEREAVT
jgi:CTP synthase